MQPLRRLVRYALLATAAQGCFIPIQRSDTVDGSRTEYVPATSTCPTEDEVQRTWQSHLDDLSLDATRNLGGRARVCWYRLALSPEQVADSSKFCGAGETTFASVRAAYLERLAPARRVPPGATSVAVPEPMYAACVDGGAVAALAVAAGESCRPSGSALHAPQVFSRDPNVVVTDVPAVDELPDVLACEYSFEYERSRGGCGSPGFGPT
ncbi:MAG: hypothetical protein HOO96_20775 [Polyangiaceae bacterium]|nr:hypothetical protein [Polyangiaceae bacterium]